MMCKCSGHGGADGRRAGESYRDLQLQQAAGGVCAQQARAEVQASQQPGTLGAFGS